MTLGPLDAAIVALFLLAILALGFSAKLRENTTLQFVAAGRALTLPVFVATLVATWYGGILGIGEMVQWYGLGTWVLVGVPYYAFAIFYGLLLAKRIRQADQISIPERLASTWGRGPGLIAAGLVFLLGVPAAHVLMLGTLTQALTGWNLTVSVVVATLVSTLFLYKGGLLADVRVSLLAFAMMYVGFFVIVIYCVANYPIGEAWASFEGTPKLTWDGGAGPMMVASFFVLGAWTLIDPGFHQRVASAATPEIGRKGVLVCVGCWILFDVLSVTTGMYALSLMDPVPDNILLLFPLFGDQILPQGLKAVFLCGMIGTILTAMVGYSLVSGATLGRDLVCRMFGIDDERAATNWSRAGIAAACIAAVVIALQFESVVKIWYLWAGTVVGAVLLPVMFSYLAGRKWRLTSLTVSISMVAGFGVSLVWLVYSGQREPDLQLVVGTLLPGAVVSSLVLGIGAFLGGRSTR
ncbi:MAG: hypothetical protein IH945_10970 [Armatimonadetes bacterium]|nr:hypothetical protein [Armatimonadota bacterium]